MTLTTLLLLSGGAALAHRPHDDTPAFTVAPDFESSGKAWAMLDPHDISQLVRTDDYGAHWDYICGPTMEDIQVDAGYQGDALVFLSSEGRVWVSEDDAETWTASWLQPTPIRTAEMALGEDYGIIGADVGLFAGDVTGDLTGLDRHFDNLRVTEVAISADDPSRSLVALFNGEIHLSVDSARSYSLHSVLDEGLEALAIAELGGELFVGTNGEGALRWNPGLLTWESCGPMPVSEIGDYVLHIPVLNAGVNGGGDDVLVAATGLEGLFFSDDDCETWELSQTGDIPEYGGIGNAQSTEEGFTTGGSAGIYSWIAGFSGVTISRDAANTWNESQLVPSDYARGVAFAPDYPEDPRIFVGGYGGGTWWSWDGGESWDGSASNMVGAYSYDVQPASDLADEGTVYFSGSLVTYLSRDGGYTWENLAKVVPVQRVRAYRPYGDRTYALGEDQVGGVISGQIAFTDDDGETWQEWENLYPLLGPSAPNDIQETVVQGEDALIVVADSPPQILRSDDDGESWRQLYAGPNFGVRASGGVVWPPGEGSRMLFADPTSGLMVSEDGGDTWAQSETWPGGTPRSLIRADDGTLFLLVRQGQIYRSDDGGDTWAEAGEPLRAGIHDLVASPNFAETGALLAGTQDGMFFTEDRGDTWQRLRRFGRLEAVAEHLPCWKAGTTLLSNTPDAGAPPPHAGSELCDIYEEPDQGLRGGWLMAIGDELHFTFTGTRFRVMLPEEGDAGELQYYLNGAYVEGIDVVGGEDLYIDMEGADGVWKDVSFIWNGATPLHVDAVEIWGDGELMSVTGEPEPGGPGGDDTGPDTNTDDGDGGTDDTGDSVTDGGGGKGCCNRDGSDGAAIVLLPLLIMGLRRRE